MSIYIGNKQVAGNSSNTANVLHGENIEEGLEYLVPENVGDVVAFRITGDSAQVMNSTEGFGLLGKINGSESLVIAVQKDNMNSIKQLVYTALVNNDGTGTEWNQLGASSSGGIEKLSAWSDSRYVIVNPDAGISETVNFPLTRALKSTDIILVTWRKESASNADAEIAGQAIFYPGAYSYDVCLEVIEDFQNSNDYYGLFINQADTEIGSTYLSMYGVSQGSNTYGPHYLIIGIYNLSGQ